MGNTTSSSIEVDVKPEAIEQHLLDDLRIASNWALPDGEAFEQEYKRLLCVVSSRWVTCYSDVLQSWDEI